MFSFPPKVGGSGLFSVLSVHLALLFLLTGEQQHEIKIRRMMHVLVDANLHEMLPAGLSPDAARPSGSLEAVRTKTELKGREVACFPHVSPCIYACVYSSYSLCNATPYQAHMLPPQMEMKPYVSSGSI